MDEEKFLMGCEGPVGVKEILRAIPDAVFTTDKDMKIDYFSEAAERLTGFKAREARGMFCKDILKSGICETECMIKKALHSQENIFNVETSLTTIDNKEVPILISASLVRTDEGKVCRFVHIFRNITDLQKTVEDLKESKQNLQDWAVELEMSKSNLEKANEELTKANTAKSNFLSIISHELRTPLTIIRGYLSLILEGDFDDKPDKAKEIFRILNKRAKHLERLIDDLLDLSRIESGKLQLLKEIIDPVKHLKETINMFGAEIENKNISVKTEIPDKLPSIDADHDKFHQVFTNLFSNAFKFTEDRGEVVVSARDLEPQSNKGFIEFSVFDKGIGIPPDELDRIFERFYQIDSTSTRQYGGSGLGLSIVKEIVDLHGGTIKVESDIGKGSKFIVTFPKAG